MTTTVTEPTLERRWTVLIPTTGLPEVRELNDAGVFPHAGRLIGAEWIEVVHAEHWQLIIDEEGALKPRPAGNPLASLIFGRRVVGAACLADINQAGTDLVWLTQPMAERIREDLVQLLEAAS